MQFEELDKRINEAASQHQPAFDTKAWEKMNQLLDEQLPQKKEKKDIPVSSLSATIGGRQLFYSFPSIQ